MVNFSEKFNQNGGAVNALSMIMKKEEEKVLQKKVIGRLLKTPGLNEWEKEFLSSLEKQILIRDLTEKQIGVLERIKKARLLIIPRGRNSRQSS